MKLAVRTRPPVRVISGTSAVVGELRTSTVRPALVASTMYSRAAPEPASTRTSTKSPLAMPLLCPSSWRIKRRAGHVRIHFVGTSDSVPDALLPLDLQNTYRARYRDMRPGWQTSGTQLEAVVRGYATPDSSVLALGCGRAGGGALLCPDLKPATGLAPAH